MHFAVGLVKIDALEKFFERLERAAGLARFDDGLHGAGADVLDRQKAEADGIVFDRKLR